MPSANCSASQLNRYRPRSGSRVATVPTANPQATRATLARVDGYFDGSLLSALAGRDDVIRGVDQLSAAEAAVLVLLRRYSVRARQRSL